MRVVIIEDERFTAEDLSTCITELRKDYEVVQFLSSIKEACDYFSQNSSFDLVFSDIHLGDGLSFEIFKLGTCKAPVIFCTAYDNYAIDAFKVNGIDYILKPINKKNILEALEKFERINKPALDLNSKMNEFMELFKHPTNESKNRSILIRYKDKIIPVRVEDIAIFFIRNETTSILDMNGKIYSIQESLEEIEQLNAPFLFRANRQYIVNRKVVQDATQHFSRKLIINTNIPFQEQITVSKEKMPSFLKWLENL
jgi:two-component system response regulator LytT